MKNEIRHRKQCERVFASMVVKKRYFLVVCSRQENPDKKRCDQPVCALVWSCWLYRGITLMLCANRIDTFFLFYQPCFIRDCPHLSNRYIFFQHLFIGDCPHQSNRPPLFLNFYKSEIAHTNRYFFYFFIFFTFIFRCLSITLRDLTPTLTCSPS